MKIIRGEIAESVHNVAIAVVDSQSRLTHYFGDPDMVIMTRSSIKPFQLLPLIESGAAEHFGFSDEQLAIMCGSHNGSDKHREVVLSNLKLADNSPDDFLCGCHLPLEMRLNSLYPQNQEDQDQARHNCSGKHSGFLALAKYLQVPPESYLEINSKHQLMIKEAVASACEFPSDQMTIGIDGCSAPNFSMPLKNLAVGFKNLALSGQTDKRTDNLKENSISKALFLAGKAMKAFPLMVSGEKRPDLDLMRSFPGNIVCKVGAESLEGIGFSNEKIGIAIKVLDGNNRALAPVCIEVLKQLGIIDKIENFPLLKKYVDTEIRNYRKLVTGNITVDFKLEKV